MCNTATEMGVTWKRPYGIMDLKMHPKKQKTIMRTILREVS